MVKAKQGKSAAPSARAGPPLPNRDVFHRINFAHQAAAFLQQLDPASGSGPSVRAGPSKKKKAGRGSNGRGETERGTVPEQAVTVEGVEGEKQDRTVEWGRLARKGTKEMKKMAVHTQIKLDPSIKRAICKTCSTVLIPGLTCKVRNRPSNTHTHMTHYTCLACKAIRSIPSPPILPALSATSTSDSSPVVASKRQPAKTAFHEREEVADDASQNGGGQKKGQVDGKKGHSLWRGDTCLSGWGAVPAEAEAGGSSTT